MNTVLLVEDSRTEAETITRYLQQGFVGVDAVNSSEDAQKYMDSNRPDLVVLDVILPGQSGFEFCRKLKSDPATKDIPVIICSTKDTDADKLWGSMLGADAYIPKPVDADKLLETINRLIAY